VIDPFVNPPEIMCDGCENRFPETMMHPSTYRYVDESWETFHFCPSCRERDRKLAEEEHLRSPHLW
jgi:hypothetical protein